MSKTLGRGGDGEQEGGVPSRAFLETPATLVNNQLVCLRPVSYVQFE